MDLIVKIAIFNCENDDQRNIFLRSLDNFKGDEDLIVNLADKYDDDKFFLDGLKFMMQWIDDISPSTIVKVIQIRSKRQDNDNEMREEIKIMLSKSPDNSISKSDKNAILECFTENLLKIEHSFFSRKGRSILKRSMKTT